MPGSAWAADRCPDGDERQKLLQVLTLQKRQLDDYALLSQKKDGRISMLTKALTICRGSRDLEIGRCTAVATESEWTQIVAYGVAAIALVFGGTMYLKDDR